MYFTNENLTELYCQRQELLVQEARNRRLARRQLRAARPKGSPRSERRSRVSFGRAIASLWGRISVPFYRA
jgi:hypothetical protein